MVLKLCCLIASHGYPPGVVLPQQDQGINKAIQVKPLSIFLSQLGLLSSLKLWRFIGVIILMLNILFWKFVFWTWGPWIRTLQIKIITKLYLQLQIFIFFVCLFVYWLSDLCFMYYYHHKFNYSSECGNLLGLLLLKFLL